MNFKLPHIDLFSFWFGFALATIFWLIILRLSRLLPKMKKTAAINRERKEIQKSFTQEHEINKFMLRKAQESHLPGAFIPFEKVMIEPKFMSRPLIDTPENESEIIPAIFHVLPVTNETPELTADMPALRYSFSDILANHNYISISGREGSGKTSALAFLTSQLITQKKDVEYLPIFLDIRQINVESESAISNIASVISKQIANQNAETITRILLASADQKRLIFLFDSLDEVDQAIFEASLDWITKLQSELPNAKIILTNNPFFTGQLEPYGFSIFTLCAWGVFERREYLSQWKKAWQEYCKSLPVEQRIPEIERCERISIWLAQNDRNRTPLECALINWLSFSGSLQKEDIKSLLEAFNNYILGNLVTCKSLELIASLAQNSPQHTFQLQQCLEFMSSNLDLIKPKTVSEEISSNEISSDNSADNSIDFTYLLQNLVANGIIKQLDADIFCFKHLSYFSYLTLDALPKNPLPKLPYIITHPSEMMRLELSIPEEMDPAAVIHWLNSSDTPLNRQYLLAGSWLHDILSITPIRGELLKRIAAILQDFRIPIEIRYRFLASISQTKDPSIFSLFNYLHNNVEPSIRKLSALGFGLLKDEKAIPILKVLCKDQSNEVQQITCLALGNIWTTMAQDALVDVIFSADDPVREVACQVLAFHAPDGHQMLKEITEMDNYLAKKAAISGLLLVNQDWVKPILEKMSVEDTQWVVRDAAGFALDRLGTPIYQPPVRLLPVLENPWTLKKAEEKGIQLPASGFPSELLFEVLDQNSPYDQDIALRYLLMHPNSKLVNWLNHQIIKPQTMVTEIAVNALYSLGTRGVEISAN